MQNVPSFSDRLGMPVVSVDASFRPWSTPILDSFRRHPHHHHLVESCRLLRHQDFLTLTSDEAGPSQSATFRRNRATIHSGTGDEVNDVDFVGKDAVDVAVAAVDVDDPGAVTERSGLAKQPYPRRFGTTIVRCEGAMVALCRDGSKSISEAVVCPQKVWPNTKRPG